MLESKRSMDQSRKQVRSQLQESIEDLQRQTDDYRRTYDSGFIQTYELRDQGLLQPKNTFPSFLRPNNES